MNITMFVYIFALYALLTPGVFIQTQKLYGSLLHGVLFVIILYFTFPLVNGNIEFFMIEVSGTNHLADALKEDNTNQEETVEINNYIRNPKKSEFRSEDETDKLLSGAYKRIQKLDEEVLSLENKVKLYSGSGGEIDLLELEIRKYKGKVRNLQTQLDSYDQTKNPADNLNEIIQTLQNEKSLLELKVMQLKNKDLTCQSLQSKLDTCNQKLSTAKSDLSGKDLEIEKLKKIQ